MPKFRCRCRDSSEVTRDIVVEAADRTGAISVLMQRGYSVLTAEEVREPTNPPLSPAPIMVPVPSVAGSHVQTLEMPRCPSHLTEICGGLIAVLGLLGVLGVLVASLERVPFAEWLLFPALLLIAAGLVIRMLARGFRALMLGLGVLDRRLQQLER